MGRSAGPRWTGLGRCCAAWGVSRYLDIGASSTRQRFVRGRMPGKRQLALEGIGNAKGGLCPEIWDHIPCEPPGAVAASRPRRYAPEPSRPTGPVYRNACKGGGALAMRPENGRAAATAPRPAPAKRGGTWPCGFPQTRSWRPRPFGAMPMVLTCALWGAGHEPPTSCLAGPIPL